MAAGLPYWDPQVLTFTILERIPGTAMPLAIQPFGLMVAAGVLFGGYLMRRWGEIHDLDDDHVRGFLLWAVISGFIGAHVFDVLAYEPHKLSTDPLILFKLWDGISSYGGVIGGTIGFLVYARRHRLPIWRYGDGAMVAFIPGFTLGRLGCTLVHDHVGAPSGGFFLAVDYPLGSIPGRAAAAGLHHNLGFYEFLYMLLLCGMLYAINKWKNRPDGVMVAAIAAAYPPVRFFLEYLRDNPEADPRYYGLTFAQWVSFVTVAVGIWLVVRLVRGNMPVPRATATVQETAPAAGGAGKKKTTAGKGRARSAGTGKAGSGGGAGGKPGSAEKLPQAGGGAAPDGGKIAGKGTSRSGKRRKKK